MDEDLYELYDPETGKLWWPKLPGFALQVGTLCQSWSDLEYAVTLLFAAAAGLPRTPTGLAIAKCLDFRDKLVGIKVAATSPEHAELCEEIIAAVDYIDNTLRPRRNRLVHDRWEEVLFSEGAVARRTNHLPKLFREQARAPRTIKPSETADEALEDVMATSSEVRIYADYIHTMAWFILEPKNPLARRCLLRERPSQPRPPLQRERPSQPGKGA